MDIVERLRIRIHTSEDETALTDEAADEIERLRKDYALAWENHILHEQIFVLTEAKIERLQEALVEIAHFNLYGDYSNAYEIPEIARAALQQKEGE